MDRPKPGLLSSGWSRQPGERPYQHPERPHGRILNIGQTFKDGSLRLVRDLPVGAPAWKRLYPQARNASESRHTAFERWGLKRLPVYGGLRGKAFAYLADTWGALTTVARLIREATFATTSA